MLSATSRPSARLLKLQRRKGFAVKKSLTLKTKDQKSKTLASLSFLLLLIFLLCLFGFFKI
jgi:hypothetical protein